MNEFFQNKRVREVGGLILIVLGIVSALSILSYTAGDPTWFNHQPTNPPTHNWFGAVGANLAEALLQLFGTAGFLIAGIPCFVGWLLMRGDRRVGSPGHWIGLGVLVLSLCSLLELIYGWVVYDGELFPSGGITGRWVGSVLRRLLNGPGAMLVSATALASVIILTTRQSFVQTVQSMAGWSGTSFRQARNRAGEAWSTWRTESAEKAELRASVRKATAPAPAPTPVPQRMTSIELDTASPAETRRDDPPVMTAPPKKPVERKPKSQPKPQQRTLPLDPGKRGFTLPSIDLLKEPEPQTIESEQELLERARLITDKLREFSVNGSVVAIHPGPVVTTFEFKPEAGVKYSKITGMTDDLSLALKAESVRIDRMAGRSTVGVEVPNRRQQTIYPRDLLSSAIFRDSESKLTMALGKDISGDVFVAPLERMPHLLIAGATGSGKSVGLNGMITSILYKAKPDEVRFIMIDTKMIELGVYADIPHLLVPVVTEAKHAAAALKWAVREMEQRYRKLASCGVRNLAQFNQLIADQPDRSMPDPKTGEEVPLGSLPQIVIVIDELADLMMVASNDVEEAIMRLAQMARAVGIHLIIATQRPSVDVITGTIKANFPSRIAFRVSQRVDSRTIIDQQGAEHLLGRGDMLFLSSGSARLTRVHGAYITEPELNRIVSFLKKMAEPVYDESVLKDGEDESEALDPTDRDEMYVKAVRTILQEGKCSVTLIQRRLQLGYARAARIVDMMEREGVVSVGEGSKPREVLVGEDFLESIEAR